MTTHRVLHVAQPTPCFEPENRDIFEEIIDLTHGPERDMGNRRRHRRLIDAAREVCGGCPEREQCLEVHGPDLGLGVVAGATDKQRAALFGEVAG